MTSEPTPPPATPVDVRSLHRPHSNLLLYYALTSLVLGPFFLFLLIPRYFRYRTLHYDFDDEGVSMRWGILFRREIHLTFARIQDIHLSSNVVERWLGLGRVLVQTASGSAKAEMTIEGLREFEAVRDFLYARMRGMGGLGVDGEGRRSAGDGAGGAAAVPGVDAGTAAELVTTLRAVATELRALRSELAGRSAAPPVPPPGGGPEGGDR